MYMETSLGQPPTGGDCSGWEKDPESFSKRIAELWVRSVFPLPLKARRASPYYPGSTKFMEVEFSDDLVVGVSLANVPDYVFAFRLRASPKTPRYYTYSCTPGGQLILNVRQPPPGAPKVP